MRTSSASDIGANDENRRSGLQLVLEQSGGALGTGDDVVGLGGETHVAQVLGDLCGPAGGVVGDVERPRADRRERLDGAGGRFVPAEHGAVEVQKQAIMFLRKGAHVRQAP